MNDSRISWAESILVGLLVFGVVGNGILLGFLAAFFGYIRTDSDIWSLVNARIVALLWVAVSIVGTLAWRGIVATKDAPRRRGAVAGVAVGLVSHPVFWLFFGLYNVVTERGATGLSSKLGYLLLIVLWPGISSLLIAGWLTAAICALLGILVLDSRSRRTKSS